MTYPLNDFGRSWLRKARNYNRNNMLLWGPLAIGFYVVATTPRLNTNAPLGGLFIGCLGLVLLSFLYFFYYIPLVIRGRRVTRLITQVTFTGPAAELVTADWFGRPVARYPLPVAAIQLAAENDKNRRLWPFAVYEIPVQRAGQQVMLLYAPAFFTPPPFALRTTVSAAEGAAHHADKSSRAA